jgi:hypothetical protein
MYIHTQCSVPHVVAEVKFWEMEAPGLFARVTWRARERKGRGFPMRGMMVMGNWAGDAPVLLADALGVKGYPLVGNRIAVRRLHHAWLTRLCRERDVYAMDQREGGDARIIE